jgi:hypothetical protein
VVEEEREVGREWAGKVRVEIYHSNRRWSRSESRHTTVENTAIRVVCILVLPIFIRACYLFLSLSIFIVEFTNIRTVATAIEYETSCRGIRLRVFNTQRLRQAEREKLERGVLKRGANA